MALSTNYQWAEPDNSSLVKNGASDIRTLGNAIDVSLWNSGYGQAGKNKIINGDFNVWQRGTSFSSPAAGSYTSDRWRISYGTAVPTTYVVSQQTFTPGSEPVSGYNSPYFWRGVLTTVGTTTEISLQQRIENVHTFANTTVTFSFYAKSDSNRTQTVNFQQNFGSGGSATVGLTAQTINTTSSWQRFSLQFSIPSTSGKTIGANSYLQATISQNLTNGNTLDIWGIQVEYGSYATPFQTASGGSLQGELAMCQRYYYRFASEGKLYASFSIGGYFESTTKYIGRHQHPVAMRTNPTTLDYANLSIIDTSGTFYAVSAAAIDTNTNTSLGMMCNFTVSGATTSRYGSVLINANTGAYLGVGAEL